jgi:AsmA protein
VTPSAIAADQVEFGAFGGRYTGQAAVALESASTFRLTADVSGVDVAALTAFAGIPDVLSGRLAGRVDVRGPLSAVSRLVDRASGTARIEIRDGIVRRLGLVRAVVLATSMRADARLPTDLSTDEAFSRLGATLRFADGLAHVEDLAFESVDLLMQSAGALRLDGSGIDLRGRVQLSEALTQRAGRDLVRYTQEDGRVTLPVTITGAAADPSVRVDTAGLATRALKNAAREEIKRRLGGLFRRK